ncbi:hypothetical protein R3P38DRAFT_3541158 [Favolaschia claudopus]|uniref:Uncharacterized protein n=1 Tax=Favolaschia claudopus TaxID=2862362 RepID=A0AAW0B6P2_9AGAR
MAAKSSEAKSVAAVASSFYRSVTSTRCKGTFLDSDEVCNGEAVLRRFREGKQKGKAYFVGCEKWSSASSNMGTRHRFTAIPFEARETIVVKLFRNEPLDEEDDDTRVLVGKCKEIIHPSHLPRNGQCSRNHYRDGVHAIAELEKRTCNAKLSLFIPIDPNDLRAVIIPLAGVPHCHPNFLRTKIPIFPVLNNSTQADSIVEAAALEQDLEGRMVQELHPGMLNNRKRRDLVKNQRQSQFPHGTDIEGVLHEFYKDRGLNINERYIHAVNTQADDGHIIVTINPSLAHLALDAMWIMVDTTFAVVHGKTNEWKLLIWLNSVQKRTVIGRIWSNRATRDAFILVWKGIFEAIETITGKKLNFKVFSPSSNLLGAIGDLEGAQAQGLADVIILRQMNCNSPPMHFDDILKLIWKTCLVHFNRGVFGLRDRVTDEVLQYLLSFPYLTTSEDIQDYYTFCAESTNPKVQGSHAQDNQIKPTSCPLLEAILLAKDLDAQTARIIEEMVASGVLENPNNSLQARFKLKAQRQARAQEKRRTSDAELITGKESRNLESKMKATQQESEDLRKQIALLTQASGSIPPSTPQRPLPVASSSRLLPSPSNSIIDVDALSDSDDDFDYAAALKSDVMSPIFKKMARDYAMPGVDDESN